MPEKAFHRCVIQPMGRDRDQFEVSIEGTTIFGQRLLGIKQVDRQEVDLLAKDYWTYVNDHVRSEIDQVQARNILTQMKTKGAKLARALFSENTLDDLWKIARDSHVLSLMVDAGLMHIPWESLFNTDAKQFLSSECVVSRFPRVKGASGNRASSRRGAHHAYIMDSVLAAKDDGRAAIVFLRENGGFHELRFPEGIEDLLDTAGDARFIHWICHHQPEQGLRISERVFFNCDDAAAHFFPHKSLLILTSCSSGSHSQTEASIASVICAESRCTVIAPSSDIPTAAGARIARRINDLILQSGPETDVASLWRQMKMSLSGEANVLTVEALISLWYGIYGHAEMMLHEE